MRSNSSPQTPEVIDRVLGHSPELNKDQGGFLRPLSNEFPGEPRIFGAMIAIWHLRPFLQRRFPLQKSDWACRLGFLGWCYVHGRREYAILRDLPAWDGELMRAIRLPRIAGDETENLFSLATFLYAIERHSGSLGALIRTPSARKRTARSFWRGDRHNHSAPPLPDWQICAILDRFGSLDCFADFLRLPKHDGSDSTSILIQKFGLHDFARFGETASLPAHDLSNPLDLSFLKHSKSWPLPLPLARKIMPAVASFRRLPTEPAKASVTKRVSNAPYSKPCALVSEHGVNLFGYAHGELGIGEDIRQVAKALQSQGVPVCIVNFKPGDNISQADRSAESLVSAVPLHNTNIFCMTGIETTRYACERGIAAFNGRYNIGLWPWELPDWPASCRHSYAIIDEIWGISSYTAHAHRHASPRPVVTMTLPVELGPVDSLGRSSFGLPPDDFLFWFAFDINSNAARKNPEGVIEAFQKAFPVGGSPRVGLVLKISHPETSCKLWKKIRAVAKSDPRIHVIEATLRRPALLALFNACDCFVSLHRAEGFGRCIAEALLLNKQVITTAHSGNLDYCKEPRVGLVRNHLIPLQPGDYMWGDGQQWAEPDLDHAAETMRSVFLSPRDTQVVDWDFSAAAVGKKYISRLNAIWSGK